MVIEVGTDSFRQNFEEMLNHVRLGNDSILINWDGKPVAALVGADLFARIRRMQDTFDTLSIRIADAYADVPATEGLAEIDSIIAEKRGR